MKEKERDKMEERGIGTRRHVTTLRSIESFLPRWNFRLEILSIFTNFANRFLFHWINNCFGEENGEMKRVNFLISIGEKRKMKEFLDFHLKFRL